MRATLRQVEHLPEREKSKSPAPSAASSVPSTQASTPADRPDGFSATRDIAFIAAICSAQLLSTAALAQTVAPLTIIGNHFGTNDPGQLSWLTAAYSLTVGTFILPAGRLGDIYGHKRLLVAGLVWFALWSLIAGFSVYSSLTLLAICRAFQGIGPAVLVPNALALVGRNYEGNKRNMIFAAFGASAPTGWTLGAVFSTIFAQLVWWPWGFWVLAIVCICASVFVILVIPADDLAHAPLYRRSEDGGENISRNPGQRIPPAPKFDLWGSLTGVSGLVLFNFAWNQAAVVGWSTVYVYVLLIVSCFLLGAFVWVEYKIAEEPLVPVRGFKAEAGLALACVGAGWASFGVWVYYQWRLIERLRGYSALSAVAQNSPVALTGLLAAMTTGFLLSKLRVAYILFFSLLFYLAGMILIATVPLHQTYWAQTFVSILIMPWGMDMSFPSGTAIVSAGLPREHQGTAASLVNTVVNYSISLSLGVAGTIVTHVNGPGEPNIHGYRGAWYFGIGLDSIGLVLALYTIFKYKT